MTIYAPHPELSSSKDVLIDAILLQTENDFLDFFLKGKEKGKGKEKRTDQDHVCTGIFRQFSSLWL